MGSFARFFVNDTMIIHWVYSYFAVGFACMYDFAGIEQYTHMINFTGIIFKKGQIATNGILKKIEYFPL